jgi:hypothetical protein
MAAPQVKETEVNTLLASGTLSVEGDLTWKQSNEKSWYKITLPVTCDTKKAIALKLIVSVNNTDRARITFTLLWNGNIRVRALCMHGSHGNKHTNDELWIRKTHKHKWTDKCQDRFAYTPTDITEATVQGLLKQFCSECGIECRAIVADLPRKSLDVDDL